MENDGKFNYLFQIKVLSLLLTNKSFVAEIFDLLKTEYFPSESVQWLTEKILSYYNEYKTLPTFDVLRNEVSKIDDPLVKEEVNKHLKLAIEKIGSDDIDYVKDQTHEFCLNQELKNAIIKSVKLLKLGKYEEIRDGIDRALKLGANRDIGLDYKVAVEDRYNDENRNTIATGWPVINDLMKGGLSHGELGCVVAPSGTGKSWVLIHLAYSALKAGHNVVYYTLELNDRYVARRVDAMVTGISLDELGDNIERIKKYTKKLPGELIVKWFPTKSVSILGIRAQLEKMAMIGKKPALVIIDYADLMKVPKGGDKHEALQDLYEELRGLSGEMKVPIWTASQTNRSGINKAEIEADSISESYGKVFTADFVLSLSRTSRDVLTKSARFYIMKSRLGADKILLNSKMDTDNGFIEIYAPNTAESNEVEKKIGNEESHEKEYLRNRLADLMGNVGKNN